MDNKKIDEVNNNATGFRKLTPVEDMDLEIYNDALIFVFQESDIHNIALSGSYSSGKSTEISTIVIGLYLTTKAKLCT